MREAFWNKKIVRPAPGEYNTEWWEWFDKQFPTIHSSKDHNWCDICGVTRNTTFYSMFENGEEVVLCQNCAMDIAEARLKDR